MLKLITVRLYYTLTRRNTGNMRLSSFKYVLTDIGGGWGSKQLQNT